MTVAYIVGGLLAYWLGWVRHDAGAQVGAPSFKLSPRIRPLVRFRPGSAYPWVVAFEVWGAGLVCLGAIGLAQERLIGSSDLPMNEWFIWGILIVGTLWIVSELIALVRRSKGQGV